MNSDIQIRFRKTTDGPESRLVKDFLNNIKIFVQEDGYEHTILEEAYAELGIPDILIVIWDKNLIKKWPKERNELTKSDIKIMHHISSFGKKGILKDCVTSQLGYSDTEISKSLKKLVDAELVEERNERIKSINIENNFFIKKIISVEAKIKDLKGAIHQAQLNENFSSHSYVLFPNEKINSKIKSQFSNKIGLIGQEQGKTILKKKAIRGKLPGSYFSWVINEYVGRLLYKSLI